MSARMEKLSQSYVTDGLENGRAMMEVFQFLINLHMQLSYTPAIVLLDMYRTTM